MKSKRFALRPLVLDFGLALSQQAWTGTTTGAGRSASMAGSSVAGLNAAGQVAFIAGLQWGLAEPVAPKPGLADEQQSGLTRLSRAGRTNVRDAQRAGIVLPTAQGLPNKGAGQVEPSQRSVS